MSNSTEASTAKLADLKRLADTNPDAYFSAMADRLAWFKKWDSLKRTSFKKPVSVKWYEGGKLNVSFNCLDRHLATRGDKIALIWEPDGLEEKARSISYRELAREVGRFANTLKKLGVNRGRVRHARLFTNRRHSLGRVWRLQPVFDFGPHARREKHLHHHG
jgi:acetyl-CoA synthetase